MIEAIPYETRFQDIQANVVDIADFNERVVGAYNSGLAERGLPADDQSARAVIPAGTGALRDFSYIAPDIPEFNGPNCVGCMDCVTQCPDTAILAKVAEPATLEERLAALTDESQRQSMSGGAFAPINVGIAFCDIRMPEKITAVMPPKRLRLRR